MWMSAAGLRVLMRAEGFRAQTYLDARGLPTIGYGHRIVPPEEYPQGITEMQAEAILKQDLGQAEAAVNRLVRVALDQGQFDALVDFAFNLGAGTLAGSTLLGLLNNSEYDSAAEQLLRWDHANVNGAEVVLPGLKARRAAEYALWYGLPQPPG